MSWQENLADLSILILKRRHILAWAPYELVIDGCELNAQKKCPKSQNVMMTPLKILYSFLSGYMD